MPVAPYATLRLDDPSQRMGAEEARAMMKFVTGHSLAPSWNGIFREEVPVWKGCKTGASERPGLWNILSQTKP